MKPRAVRTKRSRESLFGDFVNKDSPEEAGPTGARDDRSRDSICRPLPAGAEGRVTSKPPASLPATRRLRSARGQHATTRGGKEDRRTVSCWPDPSVVAERENGQAPGPGQVWVEPEG